MLRRIHAGRGPALLEWEHRVGSEREMEGKTAIVTGGAKGLGRAIVGLLAERGARVALIDIDEAALAGLSNELGPDVACIVGDIRRQAGARTAVTRAVEALGRLDILVNNAGVYPRKPLFEIDDEAWDYTFDVNLRGMYHVTATAIPLMQARKSGRVVSIASIDAYIPYPKNAHYAAAKAGVISLTKSFAAAVAGDGILVNAVSPGAIATKQLRDLGILADIERGIPVGRAAEAADIAEVVCFLASERNRYMTGETVIASGGILMS
jgi:NAD(P)-dependent dehydrogenase (short-subunit alcohol dehydrogenase family)